MESCAMDSSPLIPSSKRKSIALGVNIDHCATLRQARYRENPRECGQIIEPDPLDFALLAERAGADGITVHLREDRRHIQETDIHRLRASLRTRMNLEMAATDEMTAFALKVKPDSVCLVPENRQEITTEGGLDVISKLERVKAVVASMAQANIPTSLFIDPDIKQIEAAIDIGARIIEMHTGAWANAYYTQQEESLLNQLYEMALLAHQGGLTVNAGHGINYINIKKICAIPHLNELNIGHSIISRSLYTGIEEAVKQMKNLILSAT